MSLLGSYNDLPSCQHAIREIFSQQINPPNQRLPALEDAIDLKIKYQKTHICLPTKK